MHAKLRQSCLTLAILWTVAHQDPLPMGFARQEYWSGFPCPPLGDLPDPGIEPGSLTSPLASSGASQVKAKNLPASAGDGRDPSSAPGLGRSPGEGNGYPFRHLYLENSMGRGACQATVQEAAELDMTKQLSTYTHSPF